MRGYFNSGYDVKARQKFTVSKHSEGSGGGGKSTRMCRTELSVFFAAMHSLGICWGRLATDVRSDRMVADIQLTMRRNVIDGLNAAACIGFDQARITGFANRLPGISNETATQEIVKIIEDLQAAVQKVESNCTNGMTLLQLYLAGVHQGAAQAQATRYICGPPIPGSWQAQIQSHLDIARGALSGAMACIPNMQLSVFNSVPFGSGITSEPFTHLVGIYHMILWNVALTDCCCNCR